MELILYTLLIIFCLFLFVYLYLIVKQYITDFIKRRNEIRRNKYEHDLLVRIAEKASDSSLPKDDIIINLSNSGAISVLDEVDQCVEAGNYDDAIKWLLNAIETVPDRQEFKLKLAEIYLKSNNLIEFTALFEALHKELGSDNEIWPRLSSMAKKHIPDHKLVKG